MFKTLARFDQTANLFFAFQFGSSLFIDFHLEFSLFINPFLIMHHQTLFFLLLNDKLKLFDFFFVFLNKKLNVKLILVELFFSLIICLFKLLMKNFLDKQSRILQFFSLILQCFNFFRLTCKCLLNLIVL